MCGILGFIGKSKNPEITYDLTNALFVKTEKRGEHATGFWACEHGDSRVFYDKEPVKASVYVTREIWRKTFSTVDADLFVGHCRYTSHNVGPERINKNNHPHVSEDKRLALVHNGKILEYSAMKSRYNLRSDCDSEILLGMFESGDAYRNKEDFLKQEFPTLSPDLAYRMIGMREIFSRVNYGAMAVAIGERGDNGERFLWLFCDGERPLHVVDLRKTLGQIFFCSEPELWKAAVESCSSVKDYISEAKLPVIEFPPNHVWCIATTPNTEEQAKALAWEDLSALKDTDNKTIYNDIASVPKEILDAAIQQNTNVWKIKQFRITKTKFCDWNPNDESESKVERAKSRGALKVITRLTSCEDVGGDAKAEFSTTSTNKKKVPSLPITYQDGDAKRFARMNDDHHSDDDIALSSKNEKDEDLDSLHEHKIGGIDMSKFDDLIKELRNIVDDVDTSVKNLQKESSLSPNDFEIIITSLGDAIHELRGSVVFLRA